MIKNWIGSILLLTSASAAVAAEEVSATEPPTLSLVGGEPSPVLVSDESSGYLNLRAAQSYLYGESLSSQTRQPVLGRLDFVHRAWGVTFESGATFEESGLAPWSRQDTRLVYDDPTNLVRYTLGDLNLGSRGFQKTPMMAGLNVRREFSIRPEKTASKVSDTEIWIKRPSLVEIWIDNSLFSQLRLPAGRFNLREYPVLLGQNHVRLKIRDELGVEEIFEFDLLFGPSLLDLNESEWSYAVGLPWRDSNGDRAYNSSAGLVSLHHRWGWDESLTVGINFQNWLYRSLSGGEIAYGTDWGIFSTDVAASKVSDVVGISGRLRWTSLDRFAGWDPSTRMILTYERRSDVFFADVLASPLSPDFSSRIDAQVSRRLWGWVVGSVGGSYETAFEGLIDRRTQRAQLVIPMNSRWHWDLSFTRSQQDIVVDERGLITLTWNDDPGHFSVSALHDSASHSGALIFSRENTAPTEDWRARVGLTKDPSGDSVDAGAEWLGRRGSLRWDQWSQRGFGTTTQRSSLIGETALAWVGSEFSLSPVIQDSFALSDEGVESRLSSNGISRVGTAGTLVRPAYRGGVRVPSEKAAPALVRGRLLNEQGIPLHLVSGQIFAQDGRLLSDDFFTNRLGVFLIENLPAGQYRLRVPEAGDFELIVPSSTGEVLQLGDLSKKGKPQ